MLTAPVASTVEKAVASEEEKRYINYVTEKVIAVSDNIKIETERTHTSREYALYEIHHDEEELLGPQFSIYVGPQRVSHEAITLNVAEGMIYSLQYCCLTRDVHPDVLRKEYKYDTVSFDSLDLFDPEETQFFTRVL